MHFRVAGVKHAEETRRDWLPRGRPVRVGVTAGASTPNNKIGETVARILATRGTGAGDLVVRRKPRRGATARSTRVVTWVTRRRRRWPVLHGRDSLIDADIESRFPVLGR